MDDHTDTILVVEDNYEFRTYIETLLSRNNCRVITAEDGAAGLEKAASSVPDLIITDLKMDGMDGFEFCDRIHSHTMLSHIPIIILTALDGAKDRRKGMEYGAVDYITKPVKSDLLVMKVKNILNVRKKFSRRNWTRVLNKTFDETNLSEDEKFLQDVYRVVTDNIGRYDFSVCDLASALNVSERSLYRKVKSLTNVPVASLIREIRLQRARKLLQEKSVKTNSELAAMVGYKSAKHFHKAFKKRFGSPPQTDSRDA